eukprot:TRINITY_DN5767_c0_g1_i1.p1 TRINITY_DN5767_c0_g1~~TRINITY_DN5767_c0_g1_i1.p1  ORF type:complete len:341 (+),score=76.42 TRINITY_DN5767_c0_g1_i1:87-1109(+)
MVEVDMVEAFRQVERVTSAPAFQEEVDRFAVTHCKDFEPAGVKPEYETLHKEFGDLVRGKLKHGVQERLGPVGPQFDVEKFLEDLSPFVEAGAGGTEDSAETDFVFTLKVCSCVNDFELFRDFMLEKKAKLSETPPDVVVEPVDVVLHQDIGHVAHLMTEGLAWESVRSDDQLLIQRTSQDLGEVIVRFAMKTDLPVQESYDMLMNATEERKLWDSFTEIEKVENDRYKMSMKLPMVPKITFDVKMLVKHDFPNNGDITWAYRAYDPETNTLVTALGAPQGKGCIIAAAKDAPNSTIHSIEVMPKFIARLPNFVGRWMLSISGWYLQRVLAKYKEYKKGK